MHQHHAPQYALRVLCAFAVAAVFASAPAASAEQAAPAGGSIEPQPARPSEKSEFVDKNGDGYKEMQRFSRGGEKTREVSDKNKDGKADDFITYSAGKRTGRTSDRDFDGRIDYWYYYDAKGLLLRFEGDSNGDGKPDKWTFCERKLEVILKEQDRNFDGKVDRRAFIADVPQRNGRLIPTQLWAERDDDFDGKIDVFKQRKKSMLALAGLEPMADRKGQPMAPVYKKARVPKGRSGTDPWSVESVLKEKAEKEEMMRKQGVPSS